MPLYEYECKKCKHRFERIQSFSDQPVKKCPKCGGPVERLLSAPAVQFKGTGWYVTDYAGKTTKSEKSESESASESVSESKPDKSEKKTKDSSPAKKTSDKPSSSKA